MHVPVLQTLPVVVNVDQLAADMIRPVGCQKQSELGLFFRGSAAGDAHALGFLEILRACPGTGLNDLIRHTGIGVARLEGIHLHVVIAYFFGQCLNEPDHSRLRGSERREVRARIRRAGAAQHKNFARTPLDHLR